IKAYNEVLNKVKTQNLELKEELKISERADYIERLARQKLRLIKPGEILFIDKNKKNRSFAD
ncbi:FtsB family cell division protein, partial [Clostridium sp.]|uniref:FtsB family cell division protein n=1 Tax=Clostridium sp. TaxID=1506 RepID=UPI003BB4ECDE